MPPFREAFRRVITGIAILILVHVADVRAQEQESGNTAAAHLLAIADSLYDAREYAAALESYGTVLAGAPESGVAWYGRANALFRMERYEESIRSYQEAIDRDYRVTSAMYNATCAHALSGNLEQAVEWFARTLDAGFSNKYLMLIDADLDAIRSHPRFRRTLARFFRTDGFPQLSQPFSRIRNTGLDHAAMRDGVTLATEVVLPEGEGPFPVVLIRTPYGRGYQVFHQSHWAARGFAVVVQDVRGRGESGGTWDPWMHEIDDGHDTLEWIIRQPWSNGRVGMVGASYIAQVQWLAAASAHPALKAMIPIVSGTDPFFDTPYDHGILKLALIDWAHDTTYPDRNGSEPAVDALYTLPLEQADDARFGVDVPLWNSWVDRDRPSDWEGAAFLSSVRRMETPVLHISGLWDVESIATARNWRTLHDAGHDSQRLIFGPWAHQDFLGDVPTRRGDVDYGASAIIDLAASQVRFFDHWLKQKDVRLDESHAVRAFVTGLNEWRRFRTWPPDRSREQELFIGASGELRPEPPPDVAEYAWAWHVDDVPFQEDPTFSESTVYPYGVERDDEVRFFTTILENAVTVVGTPELDLSFSTTAEDVDFYVFLLDVDPDGTSRVIGHAGKVRAGYSDAWDAYRPLAPGRRHRVRIPMFPVAHRFAEGHRLGIVIRSDWFPRFARNTSALAPDGDRAVRHTVHTGVGDPTVLRFRRLLDDPR